MKNFQIQNASSTGTTPTSINSPKTNPESTTAGSTMNTKDKQPQVLTSRKRNVDDRKKSQI